MRKQLLRILPASILLAIGALFPVAAKPGKSVAKAPPTAATPAASAALAALFATYSEEHARLFPIEGMQLGDNRYNDQLPNDQTRAFRQQQRQSFGQYRAALHHLDRTRLSADGRVRYDLFDYLLTDQLAALQQNLWLMPFAQYYSLPNTLPLLGAGTGTQPFKTVRDYDN